MFGVLLLSKPNSSESLGLSDFSKVTLGSLTVVGPFTSQDRTCISGQLCIVEALIGVHLQDGDRYMVLETCGAATQIPGFGWSGATTVRSSGATVTWGSPVTAAGGRYQLCWCGDVRCATGVPTDFKMAVGELQLIGPSQLGSTVQSYAQDWGTLVLQEKNRLQPEVGAFQKYQCVAGQVCEISKVQGLHITQFDSYMVLDTCGQNVLERSPNQPDLVMSDLQVDAWNLPQSTQFQQLNVVTVRFTTAFSAAGGSYRICWCSFSADCRSSMDLRVDLGELKLLGPTLDQSMTCISAQNCQIQDLLGDGLTIGDQLMILDTCGVSNTGQLNFTGEHGWPQEGLTTTHSLRGVIKDASGNLVSTTSSILSKFDFSHVRVTASGGRYRMCWCAGGFNCTEVVHFGMDLGSLQLQGPSPLQQDRTCMSGQSCKLDSIFGQSLSFDDVIMIRDTCGFVPSNPDDVLPRFPNDGIVNTVMTNGEAFTWMEENSSSSYLFITAASGYYRLCWCRPTVGDIKTPISCSLAEHFATDLGELTLLGPSPLDQHRTCISGMSCTVANISGLELQYGDTLHILSTCGMLGTEVPGIPQDGLSLPGLGSGRVFTWGEEPLTTGGGQFRLCWCAAGYTCEMLEHFGVDVGELQIIGPAPNHQIFCASGYRCWGSFTGVHLSTENQLMAADECGAVVEAWPFPRSRYPEIPGFPNGGKVALQNYVGDTFQFLWGSLEPITAAGTLKNVVFFPPNSVLLGVLSSFLRGVRPCLTGSVQLSGSSFVSYLSTVLGLCNLRFI